MGSSHESDTGSESLLGKRFAEFVLAHSQPVEGEEFFDVSRESIYTINDPDSFIPVNSVIFEEIMTVYSTDVEDGRAFRIKLSYVGRLFTEDLYTIVYSTDSKWQNQPFEILVCNDTEVEDNRESFAEKLLDHLAELEEKGLLTLRA